MRLLFLILLFSSFFTCLDGQNYYVALIKGKVYYEDKLLKKRDKIKMKGVIKFTDRSDYLKVSGPGGLYTLTPGMDKESSNEFFISVKDELFPKIRHHSTSAAQRIFIDGYYFNQLGISQTFLNKTHLKAFAPELQKEEEIGFLHETTNGLHYKTGEIRDKLLLIREKDFSTPGKAKLEKTAIVKVRDKSRWLSLVSEKDSISQIEDLVDGVRWISREEIFSGIIPTGDPNPEPAFNPQTGEPIETDQVPSPAEILDFMGPPTFVNRRKMVKDLRFHLRKCKATDIEMFMSEYGYKRYIIDTYGYLREYPDIDDVLRKDLKLTSRFEDPR